MSSRAARAVHQLVFVVVLTAIGGSASRVVAAEASIAVLPLEISGGIVASRQALEAAVGRGLASGGNAVLFAEDVAARLAASQDTGACRTPACWSALGRTLGAAYVFRGAVRRQTGAFQIRFELFSTKNGLSVAREEAGCDEDDCSVGELARTRAAGLARTLASASPESPAVVTLPPAPMPSTPAGPSPLSPSPPDEPWSRRLPRWAPLALVAGGVVVVGAGITAFAFDGHLGAEKDCSDSDGRYRCRPQTKSLAEGFVGVGAGLALGGAGVYLHLRNRAASGVAVGAAIGPGSLALRGSF